MGVGGAMFGLIGRIAATAIPDLIPTIVDPDV
jgi:hypothetical protein